VKGAVDIDSKSTSLSTSSGPASSSVGVKPNGAMTSM
jgi:hypothetical protein